jgi:pyruvate ferredoxin oxidoreductase gamma subunit
MTTHVKPVGFEKDFYEVRMESIGGLGANVAGKILGEAGVLYANLNACNFASYGSEKKGSAVKSNVRFAQGDRPIRNATPIQRPNLLAIFHEALIETSSQDILAGLYPNSVVIINTHSDAQEAAKRLGITAGTVGVLPALDIAVQEGSRTNMAMLGAMAKAMEHILSPDSIVESIKRNLGKYPKLLPANINTFWRGYKEVVFLTLSSENVSPEEHPYTPPEPLLGYLTGPRGGTITQPGNSYHRNLSSSRQGFIPAFDQSKCINCAQCEMVCPDMVMVWREAQDKRGRMVMQLMGLDYQYCKGCMKCVAVCPSGALTSIAEQEGWAKENKVSHDFDKLQKTKTEALEKWQVS